MLDTREEMDNFFKDKNRVHCPIHNCSHNADTCYSRQEKPLTFKKCKDCKIPENKA